MDLKKLDYITAPEEWIEDILEKSSKTSPSKAFWRKPSKNLMIFINKKYIKEKPTLF